MSKWCNATFLQICSWMALRVSIFSANFHFWMNYSFNTAKQSEISLHLIIVHNKPWHYIIVDILYANERFSRPCFKVYAGAPKMYLDTLSIWKMCV